MSRRKERPSFLSKSKVFSRIREDEAVPPRSPRYLASIVSNSDRKEFGSVLRGARTMLSLSAAAVSEHAGVSTARLAAIEQGQTVPSPAEFDAINRAVQDHLSQWEARLFGRTSRGGENRAGIVGDAQSVAKPSSPQVARVRHPFDRTV